MRKLSVVFDFILSSKKALFFALIAGLFIFSVLFIFHQQHKVFAQTNQPPVGVVDSTISETCTVNGWALDKDTPDQSIVVHIYRDGTPGTFIGAGTANQPRPDVNTAMGTTGNHGFSITFDKTSGLFDGQVHQIYVYGIDSQGGQNNSVLNNSPRAITCGADASQLTPIPTATPVPTTFQPLAPNCGFYGDIDHDNVISVNDSAIVSNYSNGTISITDAEKKLADVNNDGKVDQTDALLITQYASGAIPIFPICSTLPNQTPVGYFDGLDNSTCSINGWTADPNSPNKSLQVHIYRDSATGTFIGGYTANQARPDVVKAGYPGDHGFNITFDEKSGLMDGKPHQIYVYGIDGQDSNQHTLLANSPKTLTCSVSCTLKPKGDANCDGKINKDDFEIWDQEFVWDVNPSHADEPKVSADFNGDGKVNTDDFNVWRDGNYNGSLPH